MPISLEEVKLSGGTRVYEKAFYGCASLKVVEIPNCITNIGKGAFEKCVSLSSITLPFIGAKKERNDDKFIMMGGIMLLPNSMDSHFGYIFGAGSNIENGKYVPSTLKEVVITGSESILDGAFYECSGIAKIKLPHSISYIGNLAFQGCNIKEIYIEDLTSWCQATINGLYLLDIKNHEPITLSYKLYVNETLLTELNSDNLDGVTSISSFAGCNSLVSVEIPSTVTKIEYGSFLNCSNLSRLEIPSSVTSIGSDAFYGCNKLTTVFIPAGVTYIDTDAFPKKTLRYCESVKLPSGWYNDFEWSDDNLTTWGYRNLSDDINYDYVVRDNKVYLTNYKGSEKDVVVPKKIRDLEVVSIGSIFEGNSDITSISLPNSITMISKRAFYGCSGLTRIQLPSSVVSVDAEAFLECDSLQYNEYDNGLYLGNDDNPYMIFIKVKDNSATSCIINAGAKYICDEAFSYCENIERIEIPRGIVGIGMPGIESEHCKIYCEVESKPDSWSNYWNLVTVADNGYEITFSYASVVWGYDMA